MSTSCSLLLILQCAGDVYIGWHNAHQGCLRAAIQSALRFWAWECLIVVSFYRLPVRVQLMLLVVAALLPVLVALLFYLAVGRQETRNFAYERVKILANNTATNLELLLSDDELMLGRIAQRPMVRALDARFCDPIIAEYGNLYPKFTNLAVRDLAGKNDCSFLDSKVTQAQMLAVPGFDQAVHNGGMTVGDAALGSLSGRWVSALFYPVRDALGKTTGLVSLPLDMLQLNERLLGALPAGALVVVVDRSGKIIMRSRDSALWAGQFVPSEMARQTMGRSQGDFSTTSAEGVQNLFAFARVAHADWRVVAGVPEEAVMAGSNAAFKSGAALVLAILVLALGLTWRVSRGIVRPIEALRRVADEVARGQTSSRVMLVACPQEIWSVAQQFNHMLDAKDLVQHALGESEARFRTLAALSSDWYWEQDRNFRFVRLDEKIQEGADEPSEGLAGKTRWDLAALNLTQSDWDKHRAVLGAREEFRNFEIQRIGVNGQVRWIAVSGTPILDAKGEFSGYRGVGTDISERKSLELEQLSLSVRIEELSRRLVQAQEQARRRFSRELHDRSSPNLAALRINLDIIASASPEARVSQAFADRVEDTRALIEDTTISVREICAELHPPVLDCGGLLSVVQSYAQQFSMRTGLQVHVHCAHGEVRLTPDLELSLFRIVQEALTNCAKHANAGVVEVNLQLDTSPMVLTVTDDGVGFDLDRVSLARQVVGLGLLNMRETAEFAGGKFRVESMPGSGTRVCVEI